MKKSFRNVCMACAAVAALYTATSAAAKKMNAEEKNIDADNPYKGTACSCNGRGDTGQPCGNSSRGSIGAYEGTIKPLLDRVLSFGGLVLLSPLFAAVSMAIRIDDPGPVIFTQKRIGKDKTYFLCHKFRTMKMSAPHDVPTHQLEHPDQYITRVGKILRKTSLDELPQIWDIFRARMSVIGPRPALWNQDDLVEERDKYSANNILPGLTGWAQINGRDELEIPDKAKLDGEYVRILRQGGRKAFQQDLLCFTGTVGSVLKKDGVVEGGTGTVHENETRTPTEEEAGFEDYGYRKTFSINKRIKKRVLVTGAGSYIGESFQTYAGKHYPDITVDTLDMENGAWREQDFSPYDAVFHVAGIAHADTGKVSEEEKERYYAVNTDLAVETAEKCKESGVRQFILMSSMIVYGNSAPYGKEKVIDEHTVPQPANFYGDSKWQADKGVRKLQSAEFKTAVLRPPVIYGKGSKGNYQTLEKLAKKLPVFPDVKNKRSMLYIDNLCEFVCLLVLAGEGGIYFPQNGEYSSTCRLVKDIGKAKEHNVHTSRLFNPLVSLAFRMPGKIGAMAEKAFGNFVYSQKLSVYDGLDYRVAGLEESIKRTEGKEG